MDEEVTQDLFEKKMIDKMLELNVKAKRNMLSNIESTQQMFNANIEQIGDKMAILEEKIKTVTAMIQT